MNRRDFYGIIASPLLRRVGLPPTPIATYGTTLRISSSTMRKDDWDKFNRFCIEAARRDQEYREIIIGQLFGEKP